VNVNRTAARLTMAVEDNGVGLPAGFSLDSTTSLGLQIVRTLVEAELGGRLAIFPRSGGGTVVLVDLPLEPAMAAPDDRGAARDRWAAPDAAG